MSDSNFCLETNRDDYSKTRLVEEVLSTLEPGQVRYRVDRFALTANNITYAVVGDMLGYWDFFPTEAGWGRIPCMGWGEVIESANPDVEIGGRYYGWFPLARTIDMKVTPIGVGLRDDGDHRTAHAAPYRTYTATTQDPFYEPGKDAESRHALLRGLFVTGFLADDFLSDNDNYFGAKRSVVLSASSKTAIAYASCAAKRGKVKVIGLTSARNAEFCREVGCYSDVLTYGEIDDLANDQDAVIVDMAGNADTLGRVHARLGDRLKYSMMIGMSHHDSDRSQPPAVGPAPQLFFAPTQMEKRSADWGPDGYRDKLAAALSRFIESSHHWLTIEKLTGTAGAEAAWNALIAGRVAPNKGQIVTLWD